MMSPTDNDNNLVRPTEDNTDNHPDSHSGFVFNSRPLDHYSNYASDRINPFAPGMSSVSSDCMWTGGGDGGEAKILSVGVETGSTPLRYLENETLKDLERILDICAPENGWQQLAELLNISPMETLHWERKTADQNGCAAHLLLKNYLESADSEVTVEKFLWALKCVKNVAAYNILANAYEGTVKRYMDDMKKSVQKARQEARRQIARTAHSPSGRIFSIPPNDPSLKKENSSKKERIKKEERIEDYSFATGTLYRGGGRQIHVLLTYTCEGSTQMNHVGNLFVCLKRNNFSASHEESESHNLARDKLGWLDGQFHRADYILVLITPDYSKHIANHMYTPLLEQRTDKATDQSQSSTQSTDPSAVQPQSSAVLVDPSDRCLNARYIYRLMQMEYFRNNCINKRFIPVLMPTATKYSAKLNKNGRELVPDWLQHTLVYTWPKDYKDLLYYMMRPDRVMKRYLTSSTGSTSSSESLKQQIVITRQ